MLHHAMSHNISYVQEYGPSYLFILFMNHLIPDQYKQHMYRAIQKVSTPSSVILSTKIDKILILATYFHPDDNLAMPRLIPTWFRS